jgi:ribonuclease R
VPDVVNLTVGKLVLNPRGFGFVVPDDPVASGDIYIAGSNLLGAMDGDRVAVRSARPSNKGAEGAIVEILKRRHTNMVGRYEVTADGVGFVVPFDRRNLADIQVVPAEASDAKSGDMVVVSMTRWPSEKLGPVGRVIEILGPVTALGVDTEVVIRQHEIQSQHAPKAVAEAAKLGTTIRMQDFEGRMDFRALTTITIDGDGARDFDDAITVDRSPAGHYQLGVHIADVSHYVPEGSHLDQDAYARGTSVYFPDRAVHMLPPELATGLCSLNPRVDRLVQSCVMEIDAQGQVVGHKMHDAVIRSDARMTYTEVNDILTTDASEASTRYTTFVPLLHQMRELFEILLIRRRRRGSIDFDLPETQVVLSELGEIEAIVPSERNIGHRLIEEFMLLTNETVASELVAGRIPAPHRVHEAPDTAKVEAFEAFVSTIGYSLGNWVGTLTPRHFQKLVNQVRGKAEERPISALMLRTMQKARYDSVSLGHFGLAASAYTHFTSPIRRYSDLLVHRRLREARRRPLSARRRKELTADLGAIAQHVSAMEQRANNAERELIQWKKVRFMADKIGEEYEGFISGVTSFGLFIEIADPYVEGMVPISTMTDDYYRFLESEHILRGESTKRVYRLGDRVPVQVARVDSGRRQMDFALIGIANSVRIAPQRRRTRNRKTTGKPERRVVKRAGRRERQTGRHR